MQSPLVTDFDFPFPIRREVLRNLEPYHIPHRESALPQLYLYVGEHPQHPGMYAFDNNHHFEDYGPNVPNPNLRHEYPLAAGGHTPRAFIYLVDTTLEGRRRFFEASLKMKVPLGPIGEPNSNPGLRGLFGLGPGDAIFARDMQGDGVAEHDVIQAFLGKRWIDAIASRKLARVQAASRVILGDREIRTPSSVWFEQSDRAKPIEHGQRCYGLSHMVEQPRRASGPPTALKVLRGELDETQLAVREFLESVTDFAMMGWSRQGPPDVQRCLRQYFDMMNAPCIGCSTNTMWHTCQLNVARPQHYGAERSLAVQIGQFGGPHIDFRDSHMSLTCMVVLSDLPEGDGCEPGRFHLLGLGVYIVLEPFTQAFFSGLLRHGGTSPLFPDNVEIPPWACRAVSVLYPPAKQVVGDVKHAFTALPGGTDMMYLTPEMTGGPSVDPSASNRSSSAMDGVVVMSDQSLMDFHSRGLLQFAHYVMRQLPPEIGIHINPAIFLSAFSSMVNGQRSTVRPWAHAPNSSVLSPYDERHRQVQVAALHGLHDRMAMCIPSANEYPRYDAVDIRNTRAIMRTSLAPVKATVRGRKRKRSGNNDDQPDDDVYDNEVEVVDDEDPDVRRDDDGVNHEHAAADDEDDDVNDQAMPDKIGDMDVDSNAGGTPGPSDINVHSLLPVRRIATTLVGSGAQSGINRETVSSVSTDDSGYVVPTDAMKYTRFLSGIHPGRLSYLIDQILDTWKLSLRFDSAHFVSMSGCMTALYDLKRTCATNNALGMHHRQRVMQYECRIIEQFSAFEAHLCSTAAGIFTPMDPTDHWMIKLAKFVHGAVVARVPVVISSADYLPYPNFPTTVYTEPRKSAKRRIGRRAGPLGDGALRSVAAALVGKVLRCWFDLSTGRVSVIRSHLVDQLTKTLGPGILFTDVMWECYQLLPRWLFSADCPRLVRTEDLDDFECEHLDGFLSAVSNWSLLKEAYPLLEQLVAEHKAFMLATFCDADDLREHEDTRSVSRRLDTGVLNRSHHTAAQATAPHRAANLPPLAGRFSGIRTSASLSVPDEVSRYMGDSQHANVRSRTVPRTTPAVLELLKDARLVATAIEGSSPLPAFNEAQMAMWMDADFLLPLRESAPSRYLISTTFDPTFARTRNGLFSILLFRCISWNSDAFRQCPAEIRRVQFTSCAEWVEYRHVLLSHFGPQHTDFYCNSRAFGQPVQQRVAQIHEMLWNTSHTCDWPEPSQFPVSFKKMTELLRAAKDKHGIPGLGALGLYLLAGDLHMHGVCDAPSVEEVGHRIVTINAGGMAGLKLLDYCSGTHGRLDAVDAFRRFYSDVLEDLTESQRVSYGWGTIVAEHLLCKIVRMWDLGYYH
ncbi:hypothetical protein BDW22DRAFT_1431254 [Trametopsis cervina]|nr:hypothetical protein BDW22DRAFT_1431254 [Trametopsis cervina]